MTAAFQVHVKRADRAGLWLMTGWQLELTLTQADPCSAIRMFDNV